MTDSTTRSVDADCIDQAAGLAAAPDVRALRAQREKVMTGTQGAHDILLGPDALGTLEQPERLLVAAYATHLAQTPTLHADYHARLRALDPALAELASQSDAPERTSSVRLKAILGFTRTLVTDPVKGDVHALATLQAAGLDTADIVALAQLIAFLTYQLRIVAGVSAMLLAGARA